MPNWLRWTLVLPAALAGYVVIQLVVGLSSESMPLPQVLRDWYSQAMNSIVAPWAFVMIGARTAPVGRALPTGIALAVLYGIFTGVVAALAVMATTLTAPLWWILLSAVAGVVTVVVTCVHIYREDQAHGQFSHDTSETATG